MFSQNDEEVAILKYFGGRIGKLLDVGAYDGVEFSNSRQLLLNGWSGILVEPDARNMVKLMELYGSNNNVVLVQALIHYAPMLSAMWFERDRRWGSTAVPECREAHQIKSKEQGGGSVMVPSIFFNEIDSLGPFDFINIDTEWDDWHVLTSIPQLTLKKCSMICVEPCRIHPREDMRTILEHNGFKLYHETPENLLMAR